MPAPAYLADAAPGANSAAAQSHTSTTTSSTNANSFKQFNNGKSAVKDAKVPRPPNAFILYRQHYHDILKNASPGLHNNEISVILGKQWKNESANVQAHYKSIATTLKAKHAQDNPGYQYNPRKPSEKKKRMTARKAAALAESENDVAGPSALASMAASSSASSVGLAVAHTGSPNNHNQIVPSATSWSSGSGSGLVVGATSVTSAPPAQVVAAATAQAPLSAPASSFSNGVVMAQASDSFLRNSSDPSLLEFKNGNLGVAVPMSDETFALILMDHNAFLDANPGFGEPQNHNNPTLEYTETSKSEIRALDDMVSWEQIHEAYNSNFGQLEPIDNFCNFFEEELQRLDPFDADE